MRARASVGERPACGEAGPARARGARGSEDAGTSSERGPRMPPADSPRFPGEGSSSQGQPGPKGKPEGAPDGRQVDIPAPRKVGPGVTAAIRPAGFWTPPSGEGRATSPSGEAIGRTGAEGGPRKASRPPSLARPYRRPTQVGRQSMPRRAGEPRSRNSAKWPRNFGRRGARESEPQRKGPGDCLPKTQDSAEGESRRIGSDACPVPEGHEEPSAQAKRRIQAPVNGGRNYNGPKVAKFLVG